MTHSNNLRQTYGQGTILIHLTSTPENRVVMEIAGGDTALLTGGPWKTEDEARGSEWYSRLVGGWALPDEQFFPLLSQVADSMNFRFSLVLVRGKTAYLVSDLVRSHPLFYGSLGDKRFVTDHVEEFLDRHGPARYDEPRMEELISMGNVLGSGTVYKGITGVQAAEVVRLGVDAPRSAGLRSAALRSARYYRHVLREGKVFGNVEEFVTSYDRVLRSVFRRMVDRFSGAGNWVVLLSGGHDSRLLVNYLYKTGVRNVICVNYGSRGHAESALSRHVAEALGYEWHFVECSGDKWKQLHESGVFDRVIAHSFNGTSTPHMQDIAAIYHLKQNGVISDRDILLPGHGGDVLPGSLFREIDLAFREPLEAAKAGLELIQNMPPCSGRPLEGIMEIWEEGDSDLVSFREFLNWQERQSKFIINSLRVYEFLGLRCCLPFWDREVVDLCMGIPPEDRLQRKLYLQAEKSGLLVEPLTEIPIAETGKSNRQPLIKRILKALIPIGVIQWGLRLTRRRVSEPTGLIRIYEGRFSSIRELLDPVADYTPSLRSYFECYLDRFTYQFDYHVLSSLYALRLSFNRNRERKAGDPISVSPGNPEEEDQAFSADAQ